MNLVASVGIAGNALGKLAPGIVLDKVLALPPPTSWEFAGS